MSTDSKLFRAGLIGLLSWCAPLCLGAQGFERAAADTIPVPDTVVVATAEDDARNLPSVPTPVPPGWETGVWEWDREALQSTKALSLLELLHEVPGIIALRGGDIGNPSTVITSGIGPGRVRIFSEGAELVPLDGGTPDLSRIGMVGLERVRVERRPGELRIELKGLLIDDPRPYTALEVGTGDLQTNLFRATFVHPDALGGNLLVALDRLDTEGPFREEPGASFGLHVRHSIVRSEKGGVAWEVRRMTSRRPDGSYAPIDLTRTDLNLRARWKVTPSLLSDVFYHRASVGTDEDRSGAGADTLITDQARSQIGIRLNLDEGAWWGEAELRAQRGDGWPSSTVALRGGGILHGIGAASAEVERQGWEGSAGTTLHGRVWSAPAFGVSLFAEAQTGRKAIPEFVPKRVESEHHPDDDPEPEDPVPPQPAAFSGFDGARIGADYRRNGTMLGASFLLVSPDSLRPMGLPLDRAGPVLPGARRTGVEFAVQVPLDRVLTGLSLEGETQFWQEAPDWTYAPTRTWQARFRYHNVFLETRNLEIWSDIGVNGRDGMNVAMLDGDDPEAGLLDVPFYQSWYGRLQIRVVSMRIFAQWENFAVRDVNRDFPDRRLPATRAMYGIRWTLWN